MKEFISVFQLSKMIVFEVEYYTLLTNEHPNFTTSANRFNQPKTDWSEGGQAQDRLLKGFPTAMAFYKKWDKHHLHELTPELYNEMVRDLLKLCRTYNHIIRELDESKRPYNPRFAFYDLKEWSKQTPKQMMKKEVSA